MQGGVFLINPAQIVPKGESRAVITPWVRCCFLVFGDIFGSPFTPGYDSQHRSWYIQAQQEYVALMTPRCRVETFCQSIACASYRTHSLRIPSPENQQQRISPHHPDTPSRALSANKFALSSTEKALRWGSKDALTLSKVSCCDVRTSLPNAMTEGAPCRWLAGFA